MTNHIDVSVVIPAYNAEVWFDDCLKSIFEQELEVDLRVELSVFLDCCSDGTQSILEKWVPVLEGRGFHVIVGQADDGQPKGVGYSKNRAVEQSSGQYLCFVDADDIMNSRRIQKQYETATLHTNSIIGSKFTRLPEDSTPRFTKWANSLSEEQLKIQIYTSHGPTLIMPTWFCHRSIYERVGGFDEGKKGVAEDLIFFYRHLRLGGEVHRCDQELLVYRYHPDAATFSVHEDTIWDLRVAEFEHRVLSSWRTFTIWNAGKQGRKLYRSLSEENRKKVSCFCDVDVKKIGTVYTYEGSTNSKKPSIPIVHFKDANPPFVLCVKMDLTGGSFENNLESLNLEEGKDYHHFN